MLIDWPLFEAHRVLALVNDQIVGSLAMWTRRPGTPDYEAHARLITADAGVRKCARRQGIGTVLVGELAAFMAARRISGATLSARVGDRVSFLASLGAAEKHRMSEYPLDLTHVDHGMLQTWLDRGAGMGDLRSACPARSLRDTDPAAQRHAEQPASRNAGTPAIPLRSRIDQGVVRPYGCAWWRSRNGAIACR